MFERGDFFLKEIGMREVFLKKSLELEKDRILFP